MKEIKLTQEKYALVDGADFDWLNQWKWCYGAGGYAYRGVGTQTSPRVYMHRLILSPPKDKFTDHINRDKLDNRRQNLRIANSRQNGHNSTRNRSEYRGVYPTYKGRGWWATIKTEQGSKYLGCFKLKKEAALAYNEAALKYHREFAVLNEV